MGTMRVEGAKFFYGNRDKQIVSPNIVFIYVAGCSVVGVEEAGDVGAAGSDVLAGSGVPAVWTGDAGRAAAGWSQGLS